MRGPLQHIGGGLHAVRLVCHLREIRGERSLTEISDLSGLARGTLSKIERGIELPPDRDVPALEAAYGASAATWWPPEILLEIQKDEPT